MGSCIQVRSFIAATPEELCEELNSALAELGSHVVDVSVSAIGEGPFMAWIKYTATAQIPAGGSLPEDLVADPEGEPVAVLVMLESQKRLAYRCIFSAVINTYDQNERERLQRVLELFDSDGIEEQLEISRLEQLQQETAPEPEHGNAEIATENGGTGSPPG